MTRMIRYTVVVVTTVGVLALLWEIRQVLLVFALSLALAAALRPVVEPLAQRGLPRGLALVLVYLFALLAVGVLIAAVMGPLIDDAQRLADIISIEYERAYRAWPVAGTPFQQIIAERMPPPEELYELLTGAQGEAAAQGLFGAAVGLFELLGTVTVILILSIYWLADSVRFERLWLSLLPGTRRARARQAWREIESAAGTYIRAEMLQLLLLGVLLWVGYSQIGVPYATLLSTLGALLGMIPWLGTPLALVAPAAVALVTNVRLLPLTIAHTVAAYTLLAVIRRRGLLQRQHYSALLVMLLIVVLGRTIGLLGIVLAPLAAVTVQIVLTNLLRPRPAGMPDNLEPLARHTEVVRLRMRVALLREQLEGQPLSQPILTSLVDRVDDLTRRAEDLMPGATALVLPPAGSADEP